MKAIILKGKPRADLIDTIIVSSFKGKGDDRALRVTDHVLKVIERVVENVIRDTVKVQQMQQRYEVQ